MYIILDIIYKTVKQRDGGNGSTRLSDTSTSELIMENAIGPDFRPLYSQIKELLIKRLAAGEWRPGDALPSEAALAQQYGVSQGTLRKALNVMEAERLVERRQGKGTFAARHSAKRSLFQFFHLVDQGGERQLPESQVLQCRAGIATRAECGALALAANTPVTRIRRVRHLNARPVISERITVPSALFPDLQRWALAEIPNTLYELYERRYGVIVVRADERLRAVAAGAREAQLLGIAKGSPLLEIDRTARNIEKRPVEWRISHCSTAHHCYLNELD